MTSRRATTRRRRTDRPCGWMQPRVRSGARVTVRSRRDSRAARSSTRRGAAARGRARVALLAVPAPRGAGAAATRSGGRSPSEFVSGMGFVAAAGGSRCGMARLAGGNDHVHVVVQLVGEDGQAA